MPKWQDAPLLEETQPKWETAPIVGEEPERKQFIPGLTAFPVEGERVGIWGVRFPRQLDALFSGMEKLDQILPPEASMEFGRVVGLASDPQKLKDDTEAAILYSVEMDAPFEESFGLINEINKISLREQGSSALKRIHQRYNAGKAALTLGDIGMETMLKTWADPIEFDKRLKEIQQLQTQIAPDAGYEWRSFWEKNFQETAEQIPNMAAAFERVSKWGILGGFAGAIMGGYIGGPPGAVKGGQLGLALLSAAGGASRIYELEAGQQFVSMMQMRDEKGNRIDPRLAVLASHAVGALNGGIEVLQWTTALKAFGISGEVFQKASQAVTKKLFAEKSLQGVLAQGTARFGFALTLETGQEVWQESNNIVFDELAKELNNRMKGTGFKPVTTEELKARYIGITEKSLRSFGVILAPGVGLHTAIMALKVRDALKIDAERNRPIRVYRRAMGGLKATPEGKQLGDIVVERHPLKPPAEGQPTETEIAPGVVEKLVDKPVKADDVVTETGEVIEAEDFTSKLSQEDRDALAEVERAEKDGLLSKEEAEELRSAFESIAVSAAKPPQVTPITGLTKEIPETQIAPGARTVPPTGETVVEGAVRPVAAGQAAAEAGLGQEGKVVEWDEVVPDEVLVRFDRIFFNLTGTELPEDFYQGYKGTTLNQLISGFGKLGLDDEAIQQVNASLYKIGYTRIGNVRLTENGPVPIEGLQPGEFLEEKPEQRTMLTGAVAKAGPGAGAVYYRGDEAERTEGLIPLTDDKDVAAAYLRGGTFETAEEAERYFESGQREKDLQRIKAYRVSPKNTLIIDGKGLKIINSLNDMGDPIAARIIQSKELLYWWRNTKPETQKVWQNILIPQLRKLGYDSIEYQDDPMTGRTLAVFGTESLFPAETAAKAVKKHPSEMSKEEFETELAELEKINQQLDKEIPLGAARQPVIDQSLSELSDKQFEELKDTTYEELDRLEDVFDDEEWTLIGERAIADRQWRQGLAEAQDKAKAVENEEYRRELLDEDIPEIVDAIRDAHPEQSDWAKMRAVLLGTVIKDRGIQKQVEAEIKRRSSGDPNMKYILESGLESIGKAIQEVKEGIPEKPEIKGALPAAEAPVAERPTPQRPGETKREIYYTGQQTNDIKGLREKHQLYTTDDITFAEVYSDRDHIYTVSPKPGANILDGTDGSQMDNVAERLVSDYDKGLMEGEHDLRELVEFYESNVASLATALSGPSGLKADTTEYDVHNIAYWLWDRLGYDGVRFSDGTMLVIDQDQFDIEKTKFDDEENPIAPSFEPSAGPTGTARAGEKAEGKRLISKEAYEAAKKRLTDPGTMRMGVDPRGFADLVTVGAYHIESGLRTFAAWSKRMIEEFGESIRPQLQSIWDGASNLTLEERAKAVRQRVKERIEEARTVRKIEDAEPGVKPLRKIEDMLMAGEKLPSLFSVKNETVRRFRELLGLDQLASPERIGWQRNLKEALEQEIPEKAMRIAAEVLVNPRALTATETAGLTIKQARLIIEYEAVTAKIRTTNDPAETILFSNEAQRVEAEIETLMRATEMSGTQTGRALNARKMMINRNYDLVSVLTRGKVNKQKTLTAQERAEFTEIVDKLQERERQVSELQEQNDKLVAELAMKPSKQKKGRSRWSQMTLEQKDTELMADIAEVRELLKAGC